MTLRKFNEQTVIIETPSVIDTYTHESSTTYEVVADVKDPNSFTVEFTASVFKDAGQTWTWTCPADGVYELSASSGSKVSNSIDIYVDSTKVTSNDGLNTQTNVSRTVRVLYAGQKIKFYLYNVEHNRSFSARVRKIPTTNLSLGTTNANSPTFYYNWPVKAPVFTTNKL